MENINEGANLREYFLNLLSKSEIKVPDEKITQMLKFLELLYNKNLSRLLNKGKEINEAS